jgi:hypothetical protein
VAIYDRTPSLTKSTITIGTVVYKGVRTKIFLPRFHKEEPYIHFLVEDDKLLKELQHGHASMRADVLGLNGETESIYESKQLFIHKSKMQLWDRETPFYEVQVIPESIVHTQNIKGTIEDGIIDARFYLTPNDSIFFLCGRCEFDGTLSNGTAFILSEEVEVEFCDFYEEFSSDVAEKNFKKQLQLIARYSTNVSFDEVKDLVEKFLLIISFLSCKRTVIRYWRKFSADKIESFYFGRYVAPEPKQEKFGAELLIERYQFKDCADTLYKNFLESDYSKHIKRSIYSLLPVNKSTIELNYLRMFSGIESMVLAHRKIKGLEFTVNHEDWNILKNELIKTIKKSDINPSNELRKLLYEKLQELKRVSIKTATQELLLCKDIELNDLWPLFNEGGKKGLVELRNKFIHGDDISIDIYDAILVASEHLQFSLERMILKILGWDIKKSTLSHAYISTKTFALTDLEKAQNKLNQYLDAD